MDNLVIHKMAGINEAIKATGAELRIFPRTVPISIDRGAPPQDQKRCREKLPPGPSTP